MNTISNDKIIEKSKLKAYADDKINLTQKLKFLFGRVENPGSQYFLID